MAVFLSILGWTAFGLAIIVGLGLDLVGLFGNWVILGAVAAAWAVTGFERFNGWTLVILAALAVLGEVVETSAAGYGASKFGGQKRTMVAAVAGCIVGAMVGTPWFPVLGTLAGACLGAFVAAASCEYIVMEKRMPTALWTGLGAALGKVAGLFAKLFIGFAMLVAAALTL